MRLLVTGGSGFLGTNVIEHFRPRADALLNLDPAPPRHSGHRQLWREVNPLDETAVVSAVRVFAPTHVLHLGARTDLRGTTLDDYAYNIRGVEIIVEAIRRAPSVARAVFASSRMVCRIGYQPKHDTDYCPTTVYGESKVRGELIVREASLAATWMLVRPTSLWGPWFDVPYRDFFLAVARGRYLHPRGVRVLKSFGYVENSVHQLERLLEARPERVHGTTLYLADYPPIELREWAEQIRHELGAPSIRSVPLPALRLAARAGDAMERVTRRPAPLTSFRLSNLLTPMVYDLAPLEDLVGEPAVTTQEGIRRTARWLREARLV